MLSPVPTGRLSRHLQNPRTLQGILPAQIQHPRKPRVRRTHAAARHVRSRRHVRQKESRIRTVLPRESQQLPFRHTARNGSLLRIGCQTPQSRLSKVSARIQTKSRLRPHGEMRHHRLRLQPILAQETRPAQHHCLQATSRMARRPIQSVRQSPEMASLARTPVTTHRPRRSYTHRAKRR